MLKCQQEPECDNPPAFRFTWPGKDESYCCAIHSFQLSRMASVMGLHLQLIPLRAEDYLADAMNEPAAAKGEGK